MLARAAPPRPVEYFTRTWTTDDGLPHNSTSRVVQDATGFMWFATLGGLARFDGREFRKLPVTGVSESLGFNIRGLAEERPGTLLVIPTGGELLRLTGSAMTVHPASAEFTAMGDTPVDLHVESSGVVWIGTFRGRLLRWQPDGTATWFSREGPLAPRSKKFTFATDEAGRTWAASDGFLAVFRDGDWQRHEASSGGSMLIAQGRGGSIWVCNATGLQRLEHGRLVTVCTHVPWQNEFNAIRHVFEDSSGNVWIASSRRGLFRCTGGRVEQIAVPFSGVSFLTEDREGNLWAATDSGAVQLREKAFQHFNVATGLRQESVSSVSEDGHGRVWLANRAGGLAAVGQGGGPQPPGWPDAAVFANVVCADFRNRLWFGGGGDGLYRVSLDDGASPKRMPQPARDPHLLFAAKNGEVWFAGTGAEELGCYRDDHVRLFGPEDGFTVQRIRAIAEDAKGHLWLGGPDGNLLSWDGARFRDFDVAPGLPHRPIHAITIDAGGVIWICTAGGLIVKDGERFHLLTQAHGLADEILQQVLEDDFGRMWFASSRGFFHVPKSELLAVVRGKAARVTSHAFGRSQGLVGMTSTPNYQPAAARSRDGRLWFAMAQGAVAIDPQRLPRDLPPPPVVIDEIRLDGAVLPQAGGLRVPSGKHRLDFRFAALTYTIPDAVMVRHQLEGADAGWVESGTDRTANYSGLPPGDYRLRVIARNSTGQWNNQGAALAFTIVPAWWETVYARAGGLLLLAGMSGWIARTVSQRRLKARLRRLEQEHALEKERARIARDLHDDLGASLTEVGLLADRLVSTPAPELGPQLAGLAWRTRRLATELSGIVWTMSPKNSTLDRLGEFIRRYAQRLFRATAIECVVRGAEQLPAIPLAPDPQHQLLATIKEALNNVLKHSRATRVIIAMTFEQETIELAVIDDGVGFAPASTTGSDGNGLRNMKSRITEIGGTLAIASVPGEGTKVTLRVPLQPARKK
ncbi:MAG TPA: ATP-binding protein [Opitutaceae bacterium]|nr:ATP-binding protein [Opitutaceae bacterium]